MSEELLARLSRPRHLVLCTTWALPYRGWNFRLRRCATTTL